MPEPDASRAAVRVRVRPVLGALLVVDAAVVALYLGSLVFVRVFGWLGEESSIARLVDMDSEVALPKWWAVVQFAIAAALLLLIAWCRRRERGRDAFGWTLLGIIFVGAGIDEAVALHEIATYPVQRITGITSGPLAAGWIFPVAAVAIIAAVVLAPFLLRLPRRTRAWFALAAVVFVAGAVGFELLAWATVAGTGPFVPLLLDLCIAAEETLELVGVSIFIAALLAYLRDHVPDHAVSFAVVADDSRREGRPAPAEPPTPTLAG